MCISEPAPIHLLIRTLGCPANVWCTAVEKASLSPISRESRVRTDMDQNNAHTRASGTKRRPRGTLDQSKCDFCRRDKQKVRLPVRGNSMLISLTYLIRSANPKPENGPVRSAIGAARKASSAPRTHASSASHLGYPSQPPRYRSALLGCNWGWCPWNRPLWTRLRIGLSLICV